MPWARGGDTSATYPPAMRVAGLAGADARSVNEVFGFFFRLSTQSAAHLTDYVVDAGTVAMIGGGNTEQLVKFAVKVGLLTKVRSEGLTAYKLVDDPEFIHIRLASEVEWERQQRADTSDLRLSVPVRARDGDLCRYCEVPVVWRGRTSSRKATLDHLEPGTAATIATLVVACKSCNSEMRDLAGIERVELKPAPARPFYTPFTAEWLTKNGRPTIPTEAERPGNQPDHAQEIPAHIPTASDPAANGATPNHADDSDPSGHRAPAVSGNARAPDPPPQFPVTAGMSSAGSGRVGSGTSRSSVPTTQPPAVRPHRRKRSPRGRNPSGGVT